MEERHEAVVVPLRNGILFVVVAAGAAQAHAEKCLGGDEHVVGEQIVFRQQPVRGFVVILHQAQEPRRREAFPGGLGELVPGELFGEELVVGEVFVKGIDEVVPVAPDLRFLAVALEPLAFRIPHKVHPMARPFLPVLRPGQQRVNQPRPGVRGRIFDKNFDILRAGRQPQQVVIRPPHQMLAGSRRIRAQPGVRKPFEKKCVHRIPCPARFLDLRHGRLQHGPVCPPVGRVFRGSGRGVAFRGLDAGALQRGIVGRAHREPFLQDLELRLGAFSRGGHLVIRVPVTHHFQEQALGGRLRIQRRAGFASFEEAFARGEDQAAFDLLAPMALDAVGLENGVHCVPEKIPGLGRGGLR